MRSLPAAASPEENALLSEARALLAVYEDAALIIQAGLYAPGSDAATDRAIRLWSALDNFFTMIGAETPERRFAQLRDILAAD